MTDAAELTRLSAALAGRYAIERELGAGGMATTGSDERNSAATSWIAVRLRRRDIRTSLR
ncbi:MAG: hypothetical protein Q7S20_13960 [Gemmatimonadaceae bacterium]|nr:hypothetical protein [Gemmatimonadaceae bacterium]